MTVVDNYSYIMPLQTGKSRCKSYPNITLLDHEGQSSSGATSHSSEGGVFSIEITDIDDIPSFEEASTSSILHYCKRRILLPYFRVLTILGWRPLTSSEESGYCLKLTSHIYAVITVLLILSGYVLQYAACFRRDRTSGFKEMTIVKLSSIEEVRVCDGSMIGLYVLPGLVHLTAYAYTMYLLRITENEQMQTLMEKAFLQTVHSPSGGASQSKLVKILKVYVLGSIVWLSVSLANQILHILTDAPTFPWMDTFYNPSDLTITNHLQLGLICLMVISLLWHDLIHITIVSSYGIQCQLLITFMRGLIERIRGKNLTIQEAIKEICDASKLLKYLNDDLAISVALLLLQSGSLATSGAVWLFKSNCPCIGTTLSLITTVLSICTWLIAFFFPIAQAARLTAACKSVKHLGHHIRARPFGYQDTSQADLDSFLLYASTLSIQAKLFRLPVKASLVFSILAGTLFILLVLGQLNLIDLGL